MPRVRLSTTVDSALLHDARSLRARNDAAMIDEALRALLSSRRAVEIESSFSAYDEHPLAEPDAWGDLATWRGAAGTS